MWKVTSVMVTEAEFLNFASRCSCSQHNRTVQHPFRSKFTLLEHVVRCCRKRVPTEIILAHVRSLHPTTDNMEVPSQRAEAFKSPEVPFVSISSNSSLFINIVFMLICGKANKAGVRETGQLSTRFHFFIVTVLAVPCQKRGIPSAGRGIIACFLLWESFKKKNANRPFCSASYVRVDEARFHVSIQPPCKWWHGRCWTCPHT